METYNGITLYALGDLDHDFVKIDCTNTILLVISTTMSIIPKALFAVLPQYVFNPAYDANESYVSYKTHGSRKYFNTNVSINGEYFRSRSDNRYFHIITKDYEIKHISNITHFFPDSDLSDQLYDINYDPNKHVIVLLQFTKNKGYFVESNQAITVANPDVTILLNKDITELLTDRPKFIPLPDDIM
jgi:hypothetical protein